MLGLRDMKIKGTLSHAPREIIFHTGDKQAKHSSSSHQCYKRGGNELEWEQRGRRHGGKAIRAGISESELESRGCPVHRMENGTLG